MSHISHRLLEFGDIMVTNRLFWYQMISWFFLPVKDGLYQLALSYTIDVLSFLPIGHFIQIFSNSSCCIWLLKYIYHYVWHSGWKRSIHILRYFVAYKFLRPSSKNLAKFRQTSTYLYNFCIYFKRTFSYMPTFEGVPPRRVSSV